MECPYCSYDNLEGVDACACCRSDLADPGALEDRRSPIERDLLQTALVDLAVGEYVEVPGRFSVREVVRRLNDTGCHCAMVVEEGGIVGIITERDLIMKLGHHLAEMDRPVRECMTPGPTMLQHTDPVVFGLNRMMVGGFRHIPLLRDDELCGVVSVRDVLGFLARRLAAPSIASAS